MAESGEPDLTLMEADIRGVATVVELVAELRQINSRLGAIFDTLHELILIGDRVAPIEKLVREIAVGLGVPVP
jgi:hypothetical protein